jgi:hypothetical protein
MADVPGADLLMNTSSVGDLKIPELDVVTLDFSEPVAASSSSPAPPPKLVPSADDIGPTRSWDGLENLNAEPYLKPVHTGPSVSEDALMKEKYEILRKFERLQKLGVPIRKRFTMDSPLDEMKMELEFIRKEKAMDATIKQFSEWFITGMSAMEWGSKNINALKMFGLQLDGLSQSAQMNVGDLEEDFEELYELYGDKMRMHPLVRIPMRTCIMVYMVHLTNQMAMKAPVPNIQDILRNNPDIARQMAAEAMKSQAQQFRAAAPAPPPQMYSPPPPPPSRPSAPAPSAAPSGPLSGLMSFLGATQQPPPSATSLPPPQTQTKKVSMPTKTLPPPSMPSFLNVPTMPAPSTLISRAPPPPAPAPTRSVTTNPSVSDILNSLKTSPQTEDKKPLKSALKKTPSSTATKSPKNSVIIKL